jgi:hypothetical protein
LDCFASARNDVRRHCEEAQPTKPSARWPDGFDDQDRLGRVIDLILRQAAFLANLCP